MQNVIAMSENETRTINGSRSLTFSNEQIWKQNKHFIANIIRIYATFCNSNLSDKYTSKAVYVLLLTFRTINIYMKSRMKPFPFESQKATESSTKR